MPDKLDGAIRIDTIPDNANVYVNGNPVGTSPLDITDVPPGKYTATIQSGENSVNCELQVCHAKITVIKIDFINSTKNEEYLDIDIEEESQEEQEEPEPENLAQSQVTIGTVLTELQKTNAILTEIAQHIARTSPTPGKIGTYDKDDSILVAVPNEPEEQNSSQYQFENIRDTLGLNADTIYVYNDGPGLLFVIISTDGKHFTPETEITEGMHKEYTDVYTIGLRSPTAHLRYRVTERMTMTTSSERFTGSRFGDRRDRKGTTLFNDDMESATLKFSPTPGAGGTITRTTDTSYSDDFSVKSTTGAGAGVRNTITYEHIDFHLSKLGTQIRFSGALLNSTFTIYIDMIHIDATHQHQAQVRIDSTGVLSVLVHGDIFTGTFHQFGTTIPIISFPTIWHVIKLTIDISTGYYVSFIIDGEQFDLSEFEIPHEPSGGARQELEVDITNQGPAAGGVSTIFYDNYIFTEDEQSIRG